jgi:hypothetical protein
MSLYNLVFGMNPDADKLLALLDATQSDFGRFRNVYMEDGYIVVHTRCGGNNREEYFPSWVEDHPWYSHDEDGDFDNTYADIYFKVPEGPEQTLVALHGLDKGANPAEQWNELFASLEAIKKQNS